MEVLRAAMVRFCSRENFAGIDRIYSSTSGRSRLFIAGIQGDVNGIRAKSSCLIEDHRLYVMAEGCGLKPMDVQSSGFEIPGSDVTSNIAERPGGSTTVPSWHGILKVGAGT